MTKDHRVFEGFRYYPHFHSARKATAVKSADKWRQRGIPTRIVPTKEGYTLYQFHGVVNRQGRRQH